MSTVEKTIEVNVPVSFAYSQWTQFEDFPKFMEGVKAVKQIDDSHLHWKAEVGGRQKDWDALIVEQHPDRRIAWTSTSGARNAGIVRFEALSETATRIALEMDVEPEGAVETAGDKLGVLDRRVQGDLERFKEYIEGRQVPTGAWRGTIDDASGG